MKLIYFILILLATVDYIKTDTRIMGGFKVDIKEFGWQLSLQYENKHVCGASIIHQNWAITAAHCVEDSFLTPNLLSLRAGSDQHAAGGTVYGVREVSIHPGYGLSMNYDVALLKMSKSFSFTVCSVQSISLAKMNDELDTGAIVTVTGWGHSKEDGVMEKYLHGVELNIVDHNECNEAYADFGGITENMICAGTKDGGKDSCKGDSGGPLIDKNRTLIGIVSWGFGCGKADKPEVHRQKNSRIIGGINANISDYPWQLSMLHFAKYHICGAAILDKVWAITAAHCIVR
uniref:Putative trypsin-like serine protease n=1 Tax=Xenopsylla cheopis TaxID=163159 RepID=A0A6M2DL83_XENCH